MARPNLTTALQTYLQTRALTPTQTWLQTFTTSARSTTPLPALQKTALFRLLATDITTSLQSSASTVLPANATSPQNKELRIHGPVVVQVLDIEDVGRSTWSQVELLEQLERGEMTKGREIIRLVNAVDNDGDDGAGGGGGDATTTTAAAEARGMDSKGPHKVLLQDCAGVKIYGFEVSKVEGVGMGMSIGAKMVLRDAVVARGVVLLERGCVEVLGGKIENWDKEWRAGRKERLKERVKRENQGLGQENT